MRGWKCDCCESFYSDDDNEDILMEINIDFHCKQMHQFLATEGNLTYCDACAEDPEVINLLLLGGNK